MQHLQHLHKLACLRSSVALTSEGGSLQALISGCGASLTLLEADSISAPVDFAGQLPLLTALALNLLNSRWDQAQLALISQPCFTERVEYCVAACNYAVLARYGHACQHHTVLSVCLT